MHEQVRSRNENFVEKSSTRIWKEWASIDNPYIPSRISCHGYDLFELVKNSSFSEVFFLLFKGEIPDKKDAKLFESLMIALINPGPRHDATRAAMNAGVGKTSSVHILPIALAVFGGEYLGAGKIEEIMRFLRKSQKLDVGEFSNDILNKLELDQLTEQDIPGFGNIYGGVDLVSTKIAEILLGLSKPDSALEWGCKLVEKLKDKGIGWLPTGLASAVLSDLGFHPRAGSCLYQLLSAPGLAAHGIELANKPITAMPYVKDEDYVIARDENV